jgi:hypothetical protein
MLQARQFFHTWTSDLKYRYKIVIDHMKLIGPCQQDMMSQIEFQNEIKHLIQ